MERREKREEIYSGKIIKVYKDTVKLPNGNFSEREIVLHKECSAVLAVHDKKIIFVRQYRYPINNYSLEIPAGISEEGETPEACARRELEEETGMIASDLKFLFNIHSSIGFCNELINIFLAENLKIGKQNLDPDEFLEIEKYFPEDALSMIKSGKITDAKTVAAVLAYVASCK